VSVTICWWINIVAVTTKEIVDQGRRLTAWTPFWAILGNFWRLSIVYLGVYICVCFYHVVGNRKGRKFGSCCEITSNTSRRPIIRSCIRLIMRYAFTTLASLAVLCGVHGHAVMQSPVPRGVCIYFISANCCLFFSLFPADGDEMRMLLLSHSRGHC